MKLLHSQESEKSRKLKKDKKAECVVIDGPGGYAVSAYPSVVIDVPAYTEQRMAYNEAGELTGVEPFIVEAHEEVLRLPESWDAVDSVVASVEERARLNPVV